MVILDDLERTIEQGFQEWVKDDTDFEMGGYSIATKHAALVEKALPALIRVARAAAELEDDSHYNSPRGEWNVHVRAMNKLLEALQQLCDLEAP
jgi:hypothetical protein